MGKQMAKAYFVMATALGGVAFAAIVLGIAVVLTSAYRFMVGA